jgi:hypothetical protein
MIWDQLAYLRTWEIAAAAGWTLFCLGSMLVPRGNAKAPRRTGIVRYSAVWLGGFIACSVLLYVVRIPPAANNAPPLAKSSAKDDPSKLANVASARD